MRKFVHIGYPKNFSTSLQRNFFPAHPEIFHAGIGPGIDYCDPLVSAAFEVYLKTAKDFKYCEVESKLKSHFSRLMDSASNSGKKVFSISSEHLCFAFVNDSVSFTEKMNRLRDLIGNETEIIMIIRNQKDLIRSLYRESVRVGFPGSYERYIYLLYKYQDRNYYYDFRYDLVYEELVRIFGKDRIHVLLFEEMRIGSELVKSGSSIKLLNDLCNILDVEYMDIDFGHFNEALPDAVITRKSELNETHRHDLGNILYETAEKHRMKDYLLTEIRLEEEESKMYEDVIVKRAMIAKASEQAVGDSSIVRYDADGIIAERISDFFTKGNYRFSEMSRITLPDSYYNMKF